MAEPGYSFENLYSEAPIPIVVLRGMDFVLDLANEAALRVIGDDKAIGRPLFDVLPELREQNCGQMLRDVLTSGAIRSGKEAFMRPHPETGANRERKTYWSFICARMQGNGVGDPRAIAVLADITAQVNVRRDMQQRVAEADESARAKDRFLAMLSHELRNPLHPITTALELMRLNGLDTREQAIIERQIGHLARLVDDLVDVSLIAQDGLVLRKRALELSAVVLEAVEIVKPLLEERHNQLIVNVPDGLGINADSDRMSQVLSNLLKNAARYSGERSRITLRGSRCNGTVRLSVIDEGIGIEPGRLEDIFEPFARYAHKEPVPAFGAEPGLGLGLAIARKLARLHGGDLYARSDGPEHGSEFVVELPWAAPPEDPGPSSPSDRRRAPDAARHRILLVDDDRDATETLKLALESLHHEVSIADDGQAALEAARAFAPDIALLDLGLPAMDGYELGSRLRRMYPQIRLIAVTGFGQAEDRMRSSAAGFEAHLTKPVALADISNAIRSSGGQTDHPPPPRLAGEN